MGWIWNEMGYVEEHYPTAGPPFALCLVARIRPCPRTGGILRLQPAHVKLDANLIRIDGGVSKVREPRNVTIQPNLAAWLAVLINRAERRFWKVRLLLHFQAGLTNAATALAHRMIPEPKHPIGLAGPNFATNGYMTANNIIAAPVA